MFKIYQIEVQRPTAEVECLGCEESFDAQFCLQGSKPLSISSLPLE